MADDKRQNGEDQPKDKRDEKEEPDSSDFGALTGGGGFDSDSGLGNLPPLSDFESGTDEEGGLSFDITSDAGEDAKKGKKSDSVGGLPPISDIPVETPVPTGGRVKPTPPDFESPSAFDTPTSDSGLDTPQPARTSFQDIAADSDFTPETPEIGPGPDSDLETPLFDSAFGTPETPVARPGDTSAKTQAMETPMFGEPGRVSREPQPDAFGFDDGAFGGEQGGGFDVGTPVPDFSPDTAPPIPGATPPPRAGVATPDSVPPMAPPALRKQKGGMLPTVVAAAVCLLVGIAAGLFLWPQLHGMIGLTNPLQEAHDQFKAESERLKPLEGQLRQIREGLREATGQEVEAAQVGQMIQTIREQIEELTGQQKELTEAVAALEARKNDVEGEAGRLTAQVKELEENIREKLETLAQTEDSVEQALNQVAIVRARDTGMRAEVQRLEDLVGQLEEANARRIATKDALSHAAQRLQVLMNESMPLGPPQYSRETRLAGLQDLQQRLDRAPWVSPDLVRDFTSLFMTELEIAANRSYFFAQVPTRDRFGVTQLKWAECLMNGNWSVYYRTLDGQNVGTYENVAQTGVPDYAFRDADAGPMRDGIEQTVMAARPQDFEQKVQVLAQKQGILETKTPFQRVFDSLR